MKIVTIANLFRPQEQAASAGTRDNSTSSNQAQSGAQSARNSDAAIVSLRSRSADLPSADNSSKVSKLKEQYESGDLSRNYDSKAVAERFEQSIDTFIG